MSSVSEKIAKRLKRRRLALKMSQHKVAIDIGSDLKYVGMVERLEINPTVKMLVRICKTLGISLEELFKDL